MAQLVDEKRLQEFVRPCLDYLIERRFIREKDKTEEAEKMKGKQNSTGARGVDANEVKREKSATSNVTSATQQQQQQQQQPPIPTTATTSANTSLGSSLPLYEPLALGLATHRSSFSPDEALAVFAEVAGQARKGVILQGN
jgi:hypothetical protein